MGGGSIAATTDPIPSRRFSTRLRVRYAETDQMGVVYHAHYIVWCEIGRTDLIRELGRSYADLESQGLYLAVADASIRYHAPARYDELVRVDTWIDRVQSRAITFRYELVRTAPGPETRLATAMTKLIALTPEGEPRTLPPALLRIFRDAAVAER